jgi:hypothetical protein
MKIKALNKIIQNKNFPKIKEKSLNRLINIKIK